MPIFELPSREITAPDKVIDDLSQVPSDVETLAAFGNAKNVARLVELPKLRTLWLSGVSEKTFNIVTSLTQLKKLTVFGLRVSALASIENLSSLNSLAVCQSAKLTMLSGLGSLLKLRSLILFDCIKIGSIDELSTLSDLEALCIEGGMWRGIKIPTLKPLSPLIRLKQLRLASIRVDDQSLQPLFPLINLNEVFISKNFPDSEFFALADALPKIRDAALFHHK